MNDSNLSEIFDKAIESDDLGVIRECLSKGVTITSKSLSKCRFSRMNISYSPRSPNDYDNKKEILKVLLEYGFDLI